MPVKKVLFYRNYRHFTGGHLKVWHYYNHVLHSEEYRPDIYFTPESVWNPDNPWFSLRDRVLDTLDAAVADVLFLGGRDWSGFDQRIMAASPVPVINLIQHVRHADPGHPHYRFLRNRAVRICVSREVAEAVASAGIAEGPVFTIPNAIDLGDLPATNDLGPRTCDVCIAAAKNPGLGGRLERHFQKAGRVVALASRISRAEFLKMLGRSKVTIFLPHEREGFFLPALEGMAMGTTVVCPDCIGNRSFCIPGVNCFRPSYDADEIVAAGEKALGLTDAARREMQANGRATVQQHDLLAERRAFLEILSRIRGLWRGNCDGA